MLHIVGNSTLTTFSELGLAEPILRALADEGYTQPTPIQAQTIPQVLAGRDVVGIAQTGTGKTAAFALPILHQMAARRVIPGRKTCRMLVLSPTRELAGQIVDSFRTYGRHLRPNVALAIGGVPMGRQVRALAGGVDVLVATPGRLMDLVQERAARLDRVETLVLDEADQMLDMGFIHAIRAIVKQLPAERRNLFFSATMPPAIAELAGQLLRDPVRVAVTPVASTVERIEQRVIHVQRDGKPALLADVLTKEPIDRALVFTRTKHGADKVVRGLAKAGIAAEAIHGNKSQSQRDRVLSAFRDGRVRTLVATDIAARGIDVSGVSHVVNFDLPNVPESYVHRIGRTARAGADGVAISFCASDERPFLRAIEKLIRIAIPASGDAGPQHGRDGAPRPGPRREGASAEGPRKPRRRRNGRPDGAVQYGEPRHGAAASSGRPTAEGRSNGEGRGAAHRSAPQGPQGKGRDGDLRGISFLQRKSRRDGGKAGQHHQQ